MIHDSEPVHLSLFHTGRAMPGMRCTVVVDGGATAGRVLLLRRRFVGRTETADNRAIARPGIYNVGCTGEYRAADNAVAYRSANRSG